MVFVQGQMDTRTETQSADTTPALCGNLGVTNHCGKDRPFNGAGIPVERRRGMN